MASIDSNTVLTMTGAMALGAGERVEDIRRPHVDGVAFRKTGKRGPRVSVTTTLDLGSAAACKSELETYVATMGTLVTVLDAIGNQWANVMVHDVQRLGAKAHLGAVGGINGGNYLLMCRWILQATDT